MAIGSIRVFAVLPLKFKEDISCIFRYPKSRKVSHLILLKDFALNYRSEDYLLSEVKAETVKPLNEHDDEKFAVFAVVCPLYKQHVSHLRIHLPQAIALQYKSNKLSHLSPTFIPVR